MIPPNPDDRHVWGVWEIPPVPDATLGWVRAWRVAFVPAIYAAAYEHRDVFQVAPMQQPR